MADFRTIQTRMWREDEWFQGLDLDERLLWMYLFTNPSASACGLYRLPIRTIAFESGIGKARAEAILAGFAQANKAHYENGVVFVVKMQELQHGDISWQIATRIASEVDKVPDGRLKSLYLMRYGYPIVTHTPVAGGKTVHAVTYQYPNDTPSIPHRYTDTDTDTVTVTDTVTETPLIQPSIAAGKRIAADRQVLNDKVPAVERVPLVDTLLELTGLKALADSSGPQAERTLADAHDAAVTLHGMGYTSPASYEALRTGWASSWQVGKTPTARPTIKQVLELASSIKTPAANNNGHGRTGYEKGGYIE